VATFLQFFLDSYNTATILIAWVPVLFTLNYFIMSKQVSDFLIERLLEWGITRIFGFPGDGINGIMGALKMEVRIVNGGKNMPAYGGILNKKELAQIIAFLDTRK
jgi:hypothetical protein